MKQRAELVEIYDSRTIASIALRLRLTRQALGWNQTQLCDFTDIAPNTYNQWEQAKGRPELDKAMLLCDKLALTLDWIYRGNAAHLPHDLAMKISNLAGDLREAS